MRSPISPATSMAASPCSTGRWCSIRISRPPGSSVASCGIWRGDPDSAIEYFERAMRLSPLDPEMFRMQAGMAMAHLFAGRFDAASSWAERAYRDLPVFSWSSASSRQAMRFRPNGRGAARDGSLAGLDPALRISNLTDWLPIHRPEDLATSLTVCERQGCRNEVGECRSFSRHSGAREARIQISFQQPLDSPMFN